MDEPPSYHSILVEDRSDLSLNLLPIESAARLCLEMHQASPSEVRILITTDDHVRQLNGHFRGIDEPTDVLTFADEEGSSGDIAIACSYATQQASLRGIPVSDEIVLLSIHGVLHLLGFDDESEEGRSEMIDRMYDVAERLGIEREPDWGSLMHEAIAR